mmetsp:Transcript_3819/g.8241  ORF Transcript_3819/g.8241 Transcript_3819/m.8241 type:complete len:84 (+) Transcript_3819:887-1138(+)
MSILLVQHQFQSKRWMMPGHRIKKMRRQVEVQSISSLWDIVIPLYRQAGRTRPYDVSSLRYESSQRVENDCADLQITDDRRRG